MRSSRLGLPPESCRPTSHLRQALALLLKLHRFPFDSSAASQLLSSSSTATLLSCFPLPATFHWNTLIHALSASKSPVRAISLYRSMLALGTKPNNHTFPCVLKACSSPRLGAMLHAHIVHVGLESDHYIQSALIHMYSAKDLIAARRVFDGCSESQPVCWNAMIDGYAKSGELALAHSIFARMECRDVISWNTLINGYALLGRLDEAKQLFAEMPQRNVVSWNCLLAAHAKCGDVAGARKTFHEMPRRDVISWNAMLSCCAQNGHSEEALAFFDTMQRADIKPTDATLVSLLSACAHLGALDRGERIHAFIANNGIKLDPILATALVDMYAKCGRIDAATNIFHATEEKDVLAWNAIIGGMAIHGLAEDALCLFREMESSSARPDDITFVSVLSACSHAGLVEEGRRLLACMKSTHGVDPKVEHYGCIVDLLARAGFLEEAMELTRAMPMQPNAPAWGALLGGCRIHCNSEMAKEAGKQLLELQPKHSGRYILLSNIYATSNRWEEARMVRSSMVDRGVVKNPGMSEIELKGVTNKFMAGDRSHPQTEDIYRKLSEIWERLRSETGYAPDTKQVLVDIEEEDKEQLLCIHSEKLAIAFGLLHTSPGGTIRVLKNLRVCADCHTVSKLVSKLYCREIVMRDRNRFHLFKDGTCSCRDYW
ncbi:hypothetical protein HPP92_008572 [Vanilla planifolia]|uniref:DYW domain-containing protein n=1 Tax=Vanilla planifolia TaxID=51239 RepID=A0A835V4L5_VANPL|nr:hypothetical protein HPP92_008572 [Vanilla planifolia]